MGTYKITVTATTEVYFNGDNEKEIEDQYERLIAGGVPINVLEQLGKEIRLEKIEKVR